MCQEFINVVDISSPFPYHAAYRIGPDSTLVRRELPPHIRGGLLSLSDRDAAPLNAGKLASALFRECARRNYGGILLDFEQSPAPDRQALAAALLRECGRWRKTLVVPESYAPTVPGARILINTALSGGSLEARLREAAARYGPGYAALDAQRLAMEFSLPEPSGEGRPLTWEALRQLMAEEAPAVFFSGDLCARYFTYTRGGQTRFVLFDDAETLAQKLRLGGALGYRTAFLVYPEVADLLPELFRQKK